MAPQKPFKDREEVKKEIRNWFIGSLVLELLGLLLAMIGIIADALDRTLGWKQCLCSCWQFFSVCLLQVLL